MNPFLHIHGSNTSGRDFVVSDLHGCFDDFGRLLSHVNFHPGLDRVFSVGDLVDRGPHSKKCLELLAKPWFYSCFGNHEQMLLQHLRQPHLSPAYDSAWLKNELKSMTDRQVFAGQFIPLLERLPHILHIDCVAHPFFVVHAEILESRESVTSAMIKQQDFSNFPKTKHRLVWGRGLMQAYEANRQVLRAHDPSLPLVFCGHTIVERPIQLARQVYIDGGGFGAFDKSVPSSLACIRLVEIASKKCWASFPANGQIVEQKIWKPSTY